MTEAVSTDKGVDVEPQSTSQSHNILVTGVTGYGKSVLIAGLSGNSADPTSSSLKGVDTKEMTPVECVLGDSVTATLWDTPGLLNGAEDSEQLLKKMAEKYVHGATVIHCMRCTDTRLIKGNDNSGMLSVEILTKHFGVTFWKNAIFALTFANIIEEYRPAWRNLTDSEKQEKFRQEIDQWKSFIEYNLIEYARVPPAIVETVSIVPVGHYTSPLLLDEQNWVEVLKHECIERLSQSVSKKVSSYRKKIICWLL